MNQPYQNQPYYPHPPQKQGPSALKIVLIVFASIAFVGFGSCVACGLLVGGAANAIDEDMKEKKAKTEAKVEQCAQNEDEAVEWSTISAALEENEAKVVAAWKGNCAKVSGQIDKIDSGLGDKPVVIIRGKGDILKSLRCQPKDHDKALSLTKGQDITVWGLGGDEIGGTLFLEHCDW